MIRNLRRFVRRTGELTVPAVGFYNDPRLARIKRDRNRA